MPHISLPDITLYHELHGAEDGRPILVISGTGNDLRRSQPDRNPVNRAGRACHYDQRGLGQADKPAGPYTMAQYADDAAELIGALGWESCAVMGTSFGGMVALNLVSRHPGLVDRLVLNCTSPGGDLPSFALDTLSDLPTEERLERTLSLFDSRYDPTAEQPIPDMPRVAYDAYRAGAGQERTGDDLAGYLNQLDARKGHDVTNDLADITCPTLVCAGRYDDVAPVANSTFMADAIPDSTLEVFDGGHMFLIQDRAAYPRINQFITG